MNYLQNAIECLNLKGIYLTPLTIKNYIQMETINSAIGNPPFKTKKAIKMEVYVDFLDCKNKYIKTKPLSLF